MNRVQTYIRYLMTNRLDEYYERKGDTKPKLRKYTKNGTRKKGQGRFIGRARND